MSTLVQVDASLLAGSAPTLLAQQEAQQENASTTSVTFSEWQHTAGEQIDGKYRLLRPIGRGGMAEVWLALHEHLKTEQAIKFLDADLKNNQQQSAIALERFRFEAQISARLAAHSRHLVAVHDAGVHQGTPYLVMEYVAGRTLLAEIDQTKGIEPSRFADMLDQMADALTAAHQLGVIHRDLKPSNVMVIDALNKTVVKVADFGIAKSLHNHLNVDRPKETRVGLLIGSPTYMSPEQLNIESACDHRTDVWAIGVMAYEALTGQSPFDGDSMPRLIVAITSLPYRPPSQLRPTLPKGIDAWFERALAKKPDQRFQSVQQMASAFRDALAHPRSAKKTRAWMRMILLLLGALLMAGLVSYFAKSRSPNLLVAQKLPSIDWSFLPPALPPPAPSPPSSADSVSANPVLTPTSLPTNSVIPDSGASTATPTSITEPSSKPPRHKEIDPSEIL